MNNFHLFIKENDLKHRNLNQNCHHCQKFCFYFKMLVQIIKNLRENNRKKFRVPLVLAAHFEYAQAPFLKNSLVKMKKITDHIFQKHV